VTIVAVKHGLGDRDAKSAQLHHDNEYEEGVHLVSYEFKCFKLGDK